VSSAPAMTPMVDEIRRRLELAFAPTALEVQDEGYKHASHGNAGKGHFLYASSAQPSPAGCRCSVTAWFMRRWKG
jgi:hypothetical protein